MPMPMPKPNYIYDPRCGELARIFVEQRWPGFSQSVSEARTASLAAEIQKAIEAWFEAWEAF